jgi:hypothetical protein
MGLTAPRWRCPESVHPSSLGDTVGVMRRRLAVTGAALAALVGEWLGHSLTYYRSAGLAGLQAGLTTGVHEYMVPLGLALLVAAAATATLWTRAWLALGARLDRSAARARSVLRGEGCDAVAGVGVTRRPLLADLSRGRASSCCVRVLALAVPMALVQCSLYLVQENLEAAVHGLHGGGLAPLVDGLGSAAWIQAAVALLIATAAVLSSGVLRSRAEAVERCERLVRALWLRRYREASSALPRPTHATPLQLRLRNALWVRPPPVLAAA